MWITVTRNFDPTDVVGVLKLKDDVVVPEDTAFAMAWRVYPGGERELKEVSLVDHPVEKCSCHCHLDQSGEMQCRCIKNCVHCHPENFQVGGD